MTDSTTHRLPAGSSPATVTPPRGKGRHRALVWTGRALLPLILGLVWQHAANRGWVNPFFTSRPSDVLEVFRHEITSAATWGDLWITAQETILGFLLGAAAGIAFGLLLAGNPLAHDIVSPYLVALNSLPRIALAPLFVLWFGLGMASKIVLVISLVFFILLNATTGAIGNVDPDLTRLARVLGLRTHEIFRKVLLPWAVPGIFAGLQLALVYALLGAVAGEMLASKAGIGQRLQFYAGTLNTAGVLAILLLLALFSTAVSMAMDQVHRRLVRYRTT